MKKNKLSLKELKIRSFVTEAKTKKSDTLKGGAAGTHYSHCSFEPCDCQSTDPFEFVPRR